VRREVFLENTPRELLFAASIAAGVVLLVWGIRALARRKLRDAHLTATEVDDFFLHVAERTKILLLILPAIYLGARTLDLPLAVIRLVRVGTSLSLIAQTALWLAGILDFSIGRYRRKRFENDPAAMMTINLFRISAVIAVWIVAGIVAIENLGFKATTLVAGLGIGGVAIALATQNILGDLFASLSIVIDKPFVIGDSIGVDGVNGTVEHIGLKTTRLRSPDGYQLILSNGDLLKSRIQNYQRMHDRRAVQRLNISLDTPAEKLERVPMLLRSAVEKHPEARFERANLIAFADAAYQFELVWFVAAGADYDKFLDVQQVVSFDIVRALRGESIELARREAR